MGPPLTEGEIRGIYHETVDGLYRYVSRRAGGDRQLAEDITQETWLRALRAWRRAGIPTQPAAWLTTVARNLLLNHFRRRPPVSLDAVSAEEMLDAMERNGIGEGRDFVAVMTHALTRLPADQARLIDDFHFERRRASQIAETLGISERAVEGRLRRAREKLRRELEYVLQLHGGTTS